MKTTKTILLIDDDIDDQEFFIDALKGIPSAELLHVANNGREALDILQNKAALPDIIFSDINMPLMNGIEYLAEMAKHPYFKNIPVIILSSATERREIAFGLGARSFIEKTSVLGTLRARIQELIKRDDEGIVETQCIQYNADVLAARTALSYTPYETIPGLN